MQEWSRDNLESRTMDVVANCLSVIRGIEPRAESGRVLNLLYHLNTFHSAWDEWLLKDQIRWLAAR